MLPRARPPCGPLRELLHSCSLLSLQDVQRRNNNASKGLSRECGYVAGVFVTRRCNVPTVIAHALRPRMNCTCVQEQHNCYRGNLTGKPLPCNFTPAGRLERELGPHRVSLFSSASKLSIHFSSTSQMWRPHRSPRVTLSLNRELSSGRPRHGGPASCTCGTEPCQSTPWRCGQTRSSCCTRAGSCSPSPGDPAGGSCCTRARRCRQTPVCIADRCVVARDNVRIMSIMKKNDNDIPGGRIPCSCGTDP